MPTIFQIKTKCSCQVVSCAHVISFFSSAPSTPTVQASPTSKGLKVFINPGEGVSEEFETVVLDANGIEIGRQVISVDQRDSDGVIRQMIDAPVETGSQVSVSVTAKSFDQVSLPAEKIVVIEAPPKEEIGVVLVTKTGVDIEWPAGQAVRFKLEVKDEEGNLVSEPIELTQTEYLVQNLLHNKKYELAIEGYDNNDMVVASYGTTITTESLAIQDFKVESTTDQLVSLSWTPDEQAHEYKIAVISSSTDKVIQEVSLPAKGSTIELPRLRPGTEYQLEMTPYDEIGRPGLVASQVFMTKPASPTSLEVVDDSMAEFITIRFTGVQQADYYEIEVYPGDANYENQNQRIQAASKTIPAQLTTNEYTETLDKNVLEFDTEYQLLIFAVLEANDGKLRSSPQRYLFSLPRK